MAWLFACTLFLSAALLFSVQPLIAKILLPSLGGSPAVWNTCMVFFQALLLAGYGYAHLVATRLTFRLQAALQVLLLLSAFGVLGWNWHEAEVPIGLSARHSPPTDAHPSMWLLTALLGMVGLPFFVLSTSAPLLQRWFTRAGHESSRDPYFLYAASNLGSLLALLCYPFLLEPNLALAAQAKCWTLGIGSLILFTLLCAGAVWRQPTTATQAPPVTTAPITIRQRLHWLVLAFVPSSLMLGVTTYITTDLAAIPLLWVIPLALYLLSFVLVFAQRPLVPQAILVRALPIGVVLVVVALLLGRLQSIWQLIPLHLFAFFVVALVCHGQLAQRRPGTDRLTEFYLWMCFGGVLGGVFNALLAPMLFQGGVLEYPLVLLLACVLQPMKKADPGQASITWLDVGLPLGVALLEILLPIAGRLAGLDVTSIVFVALGLVCYTFAQRPVRFALCLGVLLMPFWVMEAHSDVLDMERNFFGSVRVVKDEEHNQHLLVHGNTLHGMQKLDAEHRREPLTYFTRSGPIGQVFDAYARRPASIRVAVAGLGVGTLAAYAQPDQDWTFYEIDPAVVRLARDKRYFTFLSDCRARRKQEILGDARLQLAQASDCHFGLIILDAFSSDSIPTHLLTREALAVYRTKLASGGMIVFNITNRYLDLEPLMGDLAEDAGMVCFTRADRNVTKEERAAGKAPSRWIVMADSVADLGGIAHDQRWQFVPGHGGGFLWTDDFSNLFRHLHWR